MTGRVRVTGRVQPRIRHTGKVMAKVDPEVVREALGAEETGVVVPDVSQPFSLFAIRQRLVDVVRSSGGRPGLTGTTRRQKIPLSDETWERLEVLAHTLQASGISTSAGQLASVLLQQALEHLQDEDLQKLQQAVSQPVPARQSPARQR